MVSVFASNLLKDISDEELIRPYLEKLLKENGKLFLIFPK